jgi:hypothetical protein
MLGQFLSGGCLHAHERPARSSEAPRLVMGADEVSPGTPRRSKPHEQNPASVHASEGCEDSRGGTRTRDPGIIMSSDESPEKPGSPSDDAP